ncbi:hypothetical protein C7M84_002458 [Penaeus vannamei]|uniref:DUF5641 domain-containing protein n=1 Tax=Penaeus vannamei TaxID=6689 RepID=A0A423TQW1_PENVA|nr:hypothetical protein C7M84_002458 [Penaeus vannamei]
MPHHAVRHPTKLKVRVVYDLKAKFNGTSLNDHLLQGPDLTNPLIGVLMRFRHGHYAVTADIEEMFYQVKVPLEDRDVFRFLWWSDGDINKPVSDYRMNVHVFGARSSPSCVNYALRKTAEDHGGWRLNQWTANNKDVLKKIPESERDASVASLDLNASQSGYGTASYLKMVNASERVYCTLVMARARVAPLKPTTIPRLELTAATVAARMDCKLRKELGLKLEDSVFWTDSTSVLKYLFNQKARYHTFVANRVNLIRELSSASAWRYVDTKSNPADLASRGLDVDTFLTSEMWIRGPRFLHEPESSWPQVPEDVKHGSLEDDVEVKVSVMVCETVTTVMSFIEEFASRFSNWQKFVRCHAWVRRFLKRNQMGVQASSKIVRLRPFLQDGLLRVGGRLRHSGRHFNATHPIILPNKSSLVKLMSIEVMDSMETDSFINALRRFTARRGPVKSIRSDNGTNLVGAEKVLRQELQLLDQTAICDTMSTRGISWCFNPPHASHFGGVWERQIRSIRRVLSGICYQQTLTDDSLHTLFCEVEAIINGRPLTRVTDDPDCLQPLTPSMLLNLKGSPGPVMNTDNKNLYARRRWKQVQYLADLFWKRWSKEYLPLLQERQKWNIKRRDVKKGDIVLALDERLPRGTWPLARVIEVMCDSDGHVRSAKLKTVSGEYIRPISKMCLLLESEINTEN